MPSPRLSPALAALLLCAWPSLVLAGVGLASQGPQQTPSPGSNAARDQDKAAVKQPDPEEELQHALNDAGSDRAALVRNLEGFLKKYPDYPNRSGIYRALVEANLQLNDDARAADYAERMVAINPNDISILLLAIELLERHDNQAAFRRAVSYSTRILELVEHISSSERS